MDRPVFLPSQSGHRGEFNYRPDVDGLRAIAVLSVVAYHVGIPYVPRGFVGVDIFFVISGYLIIGQIIEGQRAGAFSFVSFWGKRVLRILPPYLIVILTSVAIAPFVLVTPEEYEQFASEVTWSAVMLVNHLFLSQQGYFDATSESKVLLHLWSLAVEEQFYVVAPVAAAALWWLHRRNASASVLALAALTTASFVGCILLTGTGDDKNYAFFTMPLRAWEFVAGGIVFLVGSHIMRLPQFALELAAMLGLTMLAVAILLLSADLPFPSYYAALPVLGTCFVIAAGAGSVIPLLSRLLGCRPLVAIGLISYSLYLWHWPLLTFGRIYDFGDRSISRDVVLGFFLPLILAALTYFGIEKPVRALRRRLRGELQWRTVLAGGLACAIAATSGSAVAYASPGTWLPLPPQPGRHYPQCELETAESSTPCRKHVGSRLPGIVVGDSHGRVAVRTLNHFMDPRGAYVVDGSYPGCLAFFDAHTTFRRNDTTCRIRHDRSRARLQELNPDFALIIAQWQFYRFLAQHGSSKPAKNQKSFFTKSFLDTIDTLRANGVGRILVMASPPVLRRPARECVTRAVRYGVDIDRRCSVTRGDFEERRSLYHQWLIEAVSKVEDVRIVDPIDVLCDQEWCRPYDGSTLIYSDHSHLTSEGLLRIFNANKEHIKWVSKRR